MSRESLEIFRELVWADEERLRQLRESADRASFDARLIELGHDAGYEFDRCDIESIMRDNHLAWLQRWI